MRTNYLTPVTIHLLGQYFLLILKLYLPIKYFSIFPFFLFFQTFPIFSLTASDYQDLQVIGFVGMSV